MVLNKTLSGSLKHWDVRYLIIYGVLIFLQCRLTDSTSAPPMIYRIVYWSLAFVPAIIRPGWMPGVVAMLYAISTYGPAYGYMPYDEHWYILFAVAAVSLSWKKCSKVHYRIPNSLLLMMLYPFVVEFIYSGKIASLSQTVLLIILLMFLSDQNDDNIIEKLSVGLSISTIVLSIQFILMRDQYVYSYEGVLERSSWIDPNYFGMVLCSGVVASMIELVRGNFSSSFLKWLFWGSIIVSVPVMILNASRGAILALAGSAAVLLIFSRIKVFYKILVFFAGTAFLFYLYRSNVFELLIYRMENDAFGGGSGRLDIWDAKLRFFFDEGPLRIIFGMGKEDGLRLGAEVMPISTSDGKLGFHNDYLGFLVKYGIVGLVLFIRVLLIPLKSFSLYSKKSPIVLSGVVAIALFSFSLEPFSSGGTAYWLFIMYIIMIALNKRYIVN